MPEAVYQPPEGYKTMAQAAQQIGVSLVTLHPQITYSGSKLPSPADEERLHHLAHEQCFIANSIKTQVTVGNANY